MFEIVNEQVLFGLKPKQEDRVYRLENARRIGNDMEVVLSSAKAHGEKPLRLTLAELASDYEHDGGQPIKDYLDERVKIAKDCLSHIFANWWLGVDIGEAIHNKCSEEEINGTLYFIKLEILLKSNPNISLEQIMAMLERDCALWQKRKGKETSSNWVAVAIKPKPVWSGLGAELLSARAKAIDDALAPGTNGIDFKPYISTAVELCWERDGHNQLILSSKNKPALAANANEARVFDGLAGHKVNGKKQLIWVRFEAKDDKVRTDCDFIFQARKSRGQKPQWFTMRLSMVFSSGDKNVQHQINIKAFKKRLKVMPSILDIQWALNNAFQGENFFLTIPPDAFLFDNIDELKKWLHLDDLSEGYKIRMLWKWSRKGNILIRHGEDPRPVLGSWLSAQLERF